MDVSWFFKQRTAFIRHFYTSAAKVFEGTMDAIENEKPPFDEPPYSESPEPAYLEEWLQAKDELDLIGRTAVSLLSDSLKLFLTTWEGILLGSGACSKHLPAEFKKGFLNGYLACYGSLDGISIADCPANLNVIEQIVLARNRVQHGTHIGSHHLTHDRETLRKHPSPFFAKPEEVASMNPEDREGLFTSLMNPALHIDGSNLFAAIEQAEILADWLESKLIGVRFRNR